MLQFAIKKCISKIEGTYLIEVALHISAFDTQTQVSVFFALSSQTSFFQHFQHCVEVIKTLVVSLCLLFWAETSDKLHMRIQAGLVGLKHDIHENRCHAFIVNLHLFCLYAVLLVEAFDCRLDLFLQTLYETHFFSRTLHSYRFFDDLNGSSIRSFSLQIPNNIILPQSPFIELQFLLQLKLFNPHRPIFLQIKLYLLYTLLKGLFDHVMYSTRDIFILKQKGDDQTRQRIIIKQIFAQNLPIFQSIIDDEQIYHQRCKLFVILYKAIVGIFRGVDDLRILEFQVRPKQLDTKLEDILIPAVVIRNDLDDLRRDVGVTDLMVDLLRSRTETFDEFGVVQQHLTPYVALAVGNAIIIEMLLPARSVIPEQLQADLVETAETLSEHGDLFIQGCYQEMLNKQDCKNGSKMEGNKGYRA